MCPLEWREPFGCEPMNVADRTWRAWDSAGFVIRRPPQTVTLSTRESPEQEVVGELARHPRCVVCRNHFDPESPGCRHLGLVIATFPYWEAYAVCSPLCCRGLYYASSRIYQRLSSKFGPL